MRPRIGTGSSSVVRSPAAAGLLLLFLICHAFLVSATHFHRDARPGAPAATVGPSAGHDEGTEPSSVAFNHAQCLLCRLQRNFICDLEQGIPSMPAPPADIVRREDLTAPSHSRTFYLTHSGRGPPST